MMLFLNRTNRLFINTVCRSRKIGHSKPLMQSMKLTLRCLCSVHAEKVADNNTEKAHSLTEWTKIYQFPWIRAAAILNRFKLYQTAFTVSTVPAATGLYFNNMVDLGTCMLVTGGASLTCVTLYVATSFFKRLIGVIYVDEDDVKNVKIAHLTFWGKRKDVIVPADDFMLLTESNYDDRDAFVKLCRISTNEHFYITLRFGKILKKDIFETVFGSFEALNMKK